MLKLVDSVNNRQTMRVIALMCPVHNRPRTMNNQCSEVMMAVFGHRRKAAAINGPVPGIAISTLYLG